MGKSLFEPETRKIRSTAKSRIETGALQINDDWPGLFVRGDDCLMLREVLQAAYNKRELNIFEMAEVERLISIINIGTRWN